MWMFSLFLVLGGIVVGLGVGFFFAIEWLLGDDDDEWDDLVWARAMVADIEDTPSDAPRPG